MTSPAGSTSVSFATGKGTAPDPCALDGDVESGAVVGLLTFLPFLSGVASVGDDDPGGFPILVRTEANWIDNMGMGGIAE